MNSIAKFITLGRIGPLSLINRHTEGEDVPFFSDLGRLAGTGDYPQFAA